MKDTEWEVIEDPCSLERPSTEDEIKKAVWDLRAEKLLGPDGFPMFFFRSFWEHVKGDLIRLLEELYEATVRLDMFNYSQVVVIPKRESPSKIEVYRPIAF